MKCYLMPCNRQTRSLADSNLAVPECREGNTYVSKGVHMSHMYVQGASFKGFQGIPEGIPASLGYPIHTVGLLSASGQQDERGSYSVGFYRGI